MDFAKFDLIFLLFLMNLLLQAHHVRLGILSAVVTFASNKFTVNDIAEVVHDVVEDRNLNGLIQYSIERIDTEDDDEVLPRYQIVAFPLSAYDDTVFATFTLALHYKLTSLRGNLMEYFSAEYKWSELDHSYSTGNGYFILKGDEVVWHQGKEDDDVVQLLNPVEDNEDTTSLFVETVKPTLFQADKYNVTAGSVVEGLSAVEMQLIR
uniref:SERPIN domain-containing protein n=1 Tax=Angiostrongylus cantonensis TaxID=6313 RepID=A0A0K0DIS4_ANGCA